MSWQIEDATAYVPIKLHNTMLDISFPKGEEHLLAVLDTGFSGFMLLPPKIFEELALDEMKPVSAKALLANGKRVALRGAYGSISIPVLGLFEDGLIETSLGVLETIMGMEALRKLRVELDGCSRVLNAYRC